MTGKPIRLTLLQAPAPATLALEARAFVLEARKAGILIDVVAADGPTILARLRRGEFDLAPMVWEGRTDEDPVPLFGATGPSTSAATAPPRWTVCSRRCAARPARRRGNRLLSQVAALLAADQPVIFLYRHDVPIADVQPRARAGGDQRSPGAVARVAGSVRGRRARWLTRFLGGALLLAATTGRAWAAGAGCVPTDAADGRG